MKTIKLPSLRMYELSTVVDAIPPKDLSSLKDIRLASAIAKELQESCKEYTDKVIAVNVKQQEVLKKYQAELEPKLKGLEKEEQDKLVEEQNQAFQKEINEKFGAEVQEANKLSATECICEMADDKFAFLKQLFEKEGAKFYTKKDALLLVAEALEL